MKLCFVTACLVLGWKPPSADARLHNAQNEAESKSRHHVELHDAKHHTAAGAGAKHVRKRHLIDMSESQDNVIGDGQVRESPLLEEEADEFWNRFLQDIASTGQMDDPQQSTTDEEADLFWESQLQDMSGPRTTNGARDGTRALTTTGEHDRDRKEADAFWGRHLQETLSGPTPTTEESDGERALILQVMSDPAQESVGDGGRDLRQDDQSEHRESKEFWGRHLQTMSQEMDQDPNDEADQFWESQLQDMSGPLTADGDDDGTRDLESNRGRDQEEANAFWVSDGRRDLHQDDQRDQELNVFWDRHLQTMSQESDQEPNDEADEFWESQLQDMSGPFTTDADANGKRALESDHGRDQWKANAYWVGDGGTNLRQDDQSDQESKAFWDRHLQTMSGPADEISGPAGLQEDVVSHSEGSIRRRRMKDGRPVVNHDNPIYFLHIPKSGGTSLDQLIPAVTGREYHGYDHFDWSYVKARGGVPGKDVDVISFLREPVSRAVSQYYFSRKLDFAKDMKLFNQSLEEFLEDAESMAQFRDFRDGFGSVKWLAGTFESPTWITTDDLNQDAKIVVNQNRTALCLKAAKNLEETAWFGIIEDIPRSMKLLQLSLGLEDLPAFPFSNKNVHDKPRTEIEEKLKALMPMDIWLYDYAKEVFEARWNFYMGDGEYVRPELPEFPWEEATFEATPVKSSASGTKILQANDRAEQDLTVRSEMSLLPLPIYWINLNKSVDRRINMNKMFSSLSKSLGSVFEATRVSAIDTDEVQRLLKANRFIPNGIDVVAPGGDEPDWKKHLRQEYTQSEAAILLSHLNAILRAYNAGDEVALIIEDDAVLSSTFLLHWKAYAKLAPSDWKVLQWSTNNEAVTKHDKSFHDDPWVSWVPDHFATTAYMISREGMKEILRHSYSEGVDGEAYWHVDEPEMIVADEVVYYLGQRSYTSSVPWVGTSGIASTLEEGHLSFQIEQSEPQDLSWSTASNRSESVLVVTSCRLDNEEAIATELQRLQIDVEALSYWHSKSTWIVNVVVVNDRLKLAFLDAAVVLPVFVDIRVHVNENTFNKYSFIAGFVDEFILFDYVLFKDNDMRIGGFPWNTFMERKGDSIVSGPLHEAIEESLFRNAVKPKRQWYQFHEATMWRKLQIPEYVDVSPIPTMFVEQAFTLMRGDFAKWFFEQVLTPWFIAQPTDWGVDKLWCAAAKDFCPEAPSCSIVPVVTVHEDTRQISVGKEYTDQGRGVVKRLRESPRFRAWLDATIEWEKLLDDSADVLVVLERCSRLLHSAKPNLTECATLVVDGVRGQPDISSSSQSAVIS